ncbi:MAG: CHAT domain-containing protein [Leptolyngbyaceae cyanobacterium]
MSCRAIPNLRWAYRYRRLGLVILALITGLGCWILQGNPALSRQHPEAVGQAPIATVSVLAQAPSLQASYDLYEAGRLEEAASLLAEALATYRAGGDRLREAVALSNLALVEGQQGDWSQAYQHIDQSISVLQGREITDPRRPRILAQTFTIQGQLHLAQGHENEALASFESATDLYQQEGDAAQTVRSKINQAQALQANGFYRRAIREILNPLKQQLSAQPDSLLKAEGLHSLGEALLVAGSTQQAEDTLNNSLAVLSAIDGAALLPAGDQARLPIVRAAVYMSLGNTVRSRQDAEAALNYYQLAGQAGSEANRLRADLNQLSLLVETEQFGQAANLWPSLWPQVSQPATSRDGLYTRLNFANSLINLGPGQRGPDWAALDTFLTETHLQAQALGDRRSDAYVLGTQGTVALKQTHLGRAKTLTEQALVLSASVNATDIIYRWHEQLGQILEVQGDLFGAINAYQTAVNSLKRLRTDLLAVNPDLQFSFQQSVDPIHRKLVNLLLEAYEQEEANKASGAGSANLDAARQVLESLQQEELNNYLRAACLDLEEVQIDQIAQAQSTAVIYPIILPDRLATIVSYPGQTQVATKGAEGKAISATNEVLELYPINVPEGTVDETLRQLRRDLTNRISLGFQRSAIQVYDWLIRPIEADLEANGIDTLVFVLDGGLRNVPMAALFDEEAEKFLIEKYSLALTPGLQLLAPKPLQDQTLSTLTFGLSEAVRVAIPNSDRIVRFSPLPNVPREIEQISSLIPKTNVLLNEEFTPGSFQTALANNSATVVHLATHGQFSSDPNETFIVTWEGETITIDDLTVSLEAVADRQDADVELLVLSACETATGDDRAALGLAGIAVRAGARSTLASLWQVDDVATSQLMGNFYEELATKRVTKAQALRAAQLSILNNPRYRRHPYYWAPFVMVGNWL